MATNYEQPGDVLKLATADGMSSGDPFVFGDFLPCVLTTDAEAASPYNAECATKGVWRLSVKGRNGLTNATITAGDALFYTAGDTPVLNVDDSGKSFGIALDGVVSGATTTIRVQVERVGDTEETS